MSDLAASPATIAWLRDYYAAVDALRFEQLAEFMHDSCTCLLPNGIRLVGREQILNVLRSSLEALAGIRHELRHVWETGEEVIFELEITYRRRDGQTIVRPGAGIFVLDHGRLGEQRMFADVKGVWDG